MRILLVGHSTANAESYPLGLGYVAAVLIQAGHLVDFIDLALQSVKRDDCVIARASAFRAQAIGITVFTPQYEECLALAKCIRSRLPEIKIIVGGPHPSAMPEEVLRDGAADIAVISEGETTAPRLFHSLENGGDLQKISGIAFLNDNGDMIRTDPGEKTADLDAIPYPPWELLKPDRYRGRIRGLKRANIITSRGCPYKCAHCNRGPTGGLPYRQRSICHVMGEIQTLQKKYGIGGFGFRDDIFTLDRDYTWELCDAVRSKADGIFWICQTRVNSVDRELLRKMKQAGCVCVEFGVESGNREILRKLRKQAPKEQVRQAFRYCHELGLPSVAFFMLGTPWETSETVAETVALAKELRATFTLFFLAIPFPGTALRKEFIKADLPLPTDYGEYDNNIEKKRFSFRPKGDGRYDSHNAIYADHCRRATKALVMSQLRGVRHYPELIGEHLRLNTMPQLAAKTFRRMKYIAGGSI